MIFLKRFKKYISQRYSLDLIRHEFDDDINYDYYSTSHFMINQIERGYKIYTFDNEITIKYINKNRQTIIIDKFTNVIYHIMIKYVKSCCILFDRYDDYNDIAMNVYNISMDIKSANIYINEQYHKNMLHNTMRLNFYMKDLDFHVKYKFPKYITRLYQY
jgi:hypothetical protein